MAEIKTKPTHKSARKFIEAVEHKIRREDALTLLSLFEEVTGEKPVMWGDSIVGFGRYHYSQKSGLEADWPLTGFSPRKQNLSVYIMPGFEKYQNLLEKLGKHKTSVSCLYINKLADIDMTVLKEIITLSVAEMKKRYPESN